MWRKYTLFIVLQVVILLLVFKPSLSSVIGAPSDTSGLYNSSDHVVILHKSNFTANVYGSKTAWLVEFYNSWCGFCIRFAPIWKQIAKNLKPWKNIVVIAALDCAEEENGGICRDYDIKSTPTLKFFSVNADERNLGLVLTKGDSENSITRTLIDQLQKEQHEGRGLSWPNLVPYRGTEIDTLWSAVPDKVQYQFLIFEEANSFVGAEVILDFSQIQSIRIRRVTQDNVSLSLANKVSQFPSVIVLNRDNLQTPLQLKAQTREGIDETIIQFLRLKGIHIFLKDDEHHENFENREMVNNENQEANIETNIKPTFYEDKLYQVDLENTLRYTLKREIPLSKNISGEKLEALKNYLIVLADYFPFKTRGKEFLKSLSNAISVKTTLLGSEFKKLVEETEKSYIPGYLIQRNWIGCEGSDKVKRRYPCGLWVMFHTLTVAAADNSEKDDGENPTVLKVMHGYIKNFFGCAECSNHFVNMSERRKIFNVKGKNESILWLWQAHNEVNDRLAGDDSEDPLHKKIQYPSSDHCGSCKYPNGSWMYDEVLKYLKKKYSKSNIGYEGIEVDNIKPKIGDNNNEVTINNSSASNSRKVSWDFTMFDISICVILYVVSAAILILVCVKFAVKRNHRKRFSLQNYFTRP